MAHVPVKLSGKKHNHGRYPMAFWEAEEPALILRHRAHYKGTEKTDRYTRKPLQNKKKIP